MPTVIVRRGLGTFYYQSLMAFARSRNLTVVLDRREHDRRRQQRPTGADRRRADRRAPAPPTWEQADYVAILDGDGRIN
jgi:hypothetical protein